MEKHWGRDTGRVGTGGNIRDLISLCDKMWPWHLTFSSLSWSSSRKNCHVEANRHGLSNWKRDLNYLLSGESRKSRPVKKNISAILSALQYDSIQPIRPEWLLSSDVIIIIPFIFGSMKEDIRKWKSKRWKSSQTETKGDRRRARKRWSKLIGFAKSFSNSRSQCGSTKGHYR